MKSIHTLKLDIFIHKKDDDSFSSSKHLRGARDEEKEEEVN